MNESQVFSRPLRGLLGIFHYKPSAEALGYFRFVRVADEGLRQSAEYGEARNKCTTNMMREPFAWE